MMQFALVSLIPGLIANLQDAADPILDAYAENAQRAVTLRTSDRNSRMYPRTLVMSIIGLAEGMRIWLIFWTVLAYMGLPLQIFGKVSHSWISRYRLVTNTSPFLYPQPKAPQLTSSPFITQGSFFGPYTPLQQLDLLASYDTKSYVVGSTNSLLLQQKEKYSDILINLDESNSITITSPSLRSALQLSAADRRWIDSLTQTVLDTWDPENPSRPKNMGYQGSEDSIRSQFEEYILSLLASMAYILYHESLEQNDIPLSVANIPDTFPFPGDVAGDFNPEFLATWRCTHNFELFERLQAGNRIFDIIEPRHPTAGNLNIEDIQRRFAQGVAEWHLDDRMKEGREVVGRTLQSGRERVEAGWRGVWAEVEKARVRNKRRSRSRSLTKGGREGNEKSKETLDQGATRGTLSNDSSNSSWMVVEPDPNSPPSSSFTAADHNPNPNPVNPNTTASKHPAPAASAWTSHLRDRAAKVDTAQLQASAREGAVRAGAYLSSWGVWAKERMAQQQQGKSGVEAQREWEGGEEPRGRDTGRVDDHLGGREGRR